MVTPITIALRGAAVLLALSLLAAALAGPGPAAAGPDLPLTDEDVVRLHVSGMADERIIERIRASEVEFDLSDEMLAELRSAGLPETLLQAMIERQREFDAEHAPPAEPDAVPPPAVPRLVIRLNPDWVPNDDQPRPILRVLDVIDRSTYELLRLRSDQPRFTDVALVLACRTPDHVPDQWRAKTPLGRDFINTPRHKLLAFLPGATRKEVGQLREFASRLALLPGEREGRPEPGLLELEIPAVIDVEIEPGLVHDLTLGVALQTEERYYLIAADLLDGFILPEDGATIEAEIDNGRGQDPTSVEVRFKRTAP